MKQTLSPPQICSYHVVPPAPFTDDPRAVALWESVDYGKISLADAKLGKADRAVRVFTDGVFDLFHMGHARLLEQAKNVFPNVYLIAAIPNDAAVKEVKGITVLNALERDAPFFASVDELKRLKVDFIAHDPLPYPLPNGEDYYDQFKREDMYVPTERTKGISTTDIVHRILANYDAFRDRNLKRGLSDPVIGTSSDER